MKQSVSTIYRIIEEFWRTIQQQGISAAVLRDQIPPANLGPTGNTGQGYTPDPDAVTRVNVRKNSTGSVYSRRRLNFIEGTDITLTVADDSGNEEIDITIDASGGGGGSSVIHTDAYGSPPGSPTDGDTWIPSDSPYTAYRVSSAWVWRYKGGPVSPPVAASLTAINQSTSVFTATGGAYHLKALANATSNLRILEKAPPGATFILRVGLARGFYNANFAHAGILVRDHVGGRIANLALFQAEATYSVLIQTFTGYTSGFNSTVLTWAPGFVPDYLEIEETASNRIYRVGRLGFVTEQIYSEAVATWLTTTRAGVYVDANNGTYDAFIDVYDFQLT